MMDKKLKTHVDNLFKNAPATAKAYEAKEEILQNLKEKYNDLVSEGKSPQEAYEISVESIGDISELFDEAKKETGTNGSAYQKYIALRAVAAMVFVLALIPLSLALSYKLTAINIVLSVLLITGGVLLSVYNNKQKAGIHYESGGEYKMSEMERKRQTRRSVSGFLWLMTVVLYFILSFATAAWHLTWLIFIVTAAIEQILNIWLGNAKAGR